MADPADITGNNDFTEEKLKLHRSRTQTQVARGKCLFCSTLILPDSNAEPDALLKLYCDEDCREDYEREQLIRNKTTRMLIRTKGT